jgi:glyoxylase-like metal-dependent hydrolase (beta-lactamase superfamily II)
MNPSLLNHDLSRASTTDCSHCRPIPRGILSIDGDISKLDAHRALAYYPIRDRVWTVVDNVYRTIFVEGNKGVIAFDTFDTPGAASAYRETIRRIVPHKPIHTLMYSHDHLDHTGFGANLAPKADVWAHELCARIVTARGADGQLPITEVFHGERRLVDIDGVRFELLYPGPTHGDGNMAAYFPDQKLLFVVDLIAAGAAYTFYPDMHLGSWLKAFKRFLGLDWDILVPGHFWPLTREYVVKNIAFHERTEEVAQEAFGAGIDPDDFPAVSRFAKQTLHGIYGNEFRFDEYIAQNVHRALQHYLMGGWGFEGNVPISSEPFEPR